MEIFIVWLLLAVGVGFLADSRGRSGFGFFLLSALLSPLLGLIIVLVIRNPKDEEQKEQIRREEHEKQLESIRAIAAPRTTQPTPQTPATTPPTSVADEIRKLGELRDRGLLTEAEFQTQKGVLLKPQSPTAAAPPIHFPEHNESENKAREQAAGLADPELVSAVWGGSWATASRLLSSGVKPIGFDESGNSLLDLARKRGDRQMIELLESYAAH